MVSARDPAWKVAVLLRFGLGLGLGAGIVPVCLPRHEVWEPEGDGRGEKRDQRELDDAPLGPLRAVPRVRARVRARVRVRVRVRIRVRVDRHRDP